MNHRRVFLSSLAVVVAVVAATVCTAISQDAARAAVPAPVAGNAVVSLSVGDARTSSTAIGPLAGAVFGFFTSNPSASVNASTGFATATPQFTCTSDAAGDCSVQIPIGTGAGRVGQNTRLWVAPISAPAGYYANAQLETAPLTGGGQVTLPVVYQTPALVAGETYRSGSDWMTDPGIQTTPTSSTSEYTRRVASNGVWVLSRANPPLPAQCGLNVGFVVDLSSSMTAASIAQLKTAMTAFVDALRGTPSQAALVTFGSDSPAAGFAANSGLQSVATNADASAFESRYSAWTTTPTNYTNWDRGLAAAASLNDPTPGASNHIDLAVLITDGDPTVSGPNPVNGATLADRNSGYTRFKEISNGIASANLVKSQSTRVLAVGVGAGVTSAGAGLNLRSVSGTTPYTGSNIASADYIQTSDYATVSSALRNLVLSACAPSVSVIKRIVPYGWTPSSGTPIDSVAYTPSEQWQFTASTTSPGSAVDAPATRLTDLTTGATSFDVDVAPADSPGTFNIAETNEAGYTPLPAQTSCVNKATGSDVGVPVTQDSATQFSLPVGFQDVVSCVVYNQAPDLNQASVVVHKRWRVTTSSGTTGYLNGQQPPELEAALTLGGPGGSPPTEQPWDEPRSGYNAVTDASVNIGETFNNARIPGCTLASSTVAAGDLSADAPDTGIPFTATTTQPLGPGGNQWTLTNTVVCHSYLTLVKNVASGTASPGDWTLTAHGPAGAPPGPDGLTGTAQTTNVEVAPNATYQLAETVNPDAVDATRYYAQTDLRSHPIQYPLSTGSWGCTVNGPTPRIFTAEGTEGAISVPLGQSATCTAENNTASITIIKNVVGGTAQPSDFTFHLQPLDRSGLDYAGIDVRAGAEPAGNTAAITPLRHYILTESGGPAGYELTNLRCTSGIRAEAANNIYAEPGGSITCTATNTWSEWTVTKTSNPPSGSTVQPGSTITYTITAELLNGVPTTNVSIADDLADVLNHATLVEGSITAETGTASISGTTLTWSIPSLARTVTLTYQVRVDDDAWSTTIRNSLTTVDTSGGDPARPCPPSNSDCRESVHTTPPQPPAGVTPGAPDGSSSASGGGTGPGTPWLSATGSDIVGAGTVALLALSAGLVLVAISRRRTRHSS